MKKEQKLDFHAQAEQMLNIIEPRINAGQKQAALNFLILKFKSLYEQGISNGRLYEREGIYPYNSIDDN